MKSPNRTAPPVVEECTALAYSRPPGALPCIELVSIRQGDGTAHIDGRPQPYQADQLFLLGPASTYAFVGTRPGRFGVLRFYPASPPGPAAWAALHALAVHTAHAAHGRLEPDAPALDRLQALLVLLLGAPLADTLTEALLRAVLDVLHGPPATASYGAACVQRVLQYIRQHITEPARLRLEHLAAEFAYSPQHLSALFKRETGASVHQYIVRYKLQLVEARLLRSTHTISQIADELAFTDVSHLNKLFKKHYRATPSGYRRHRATLTPALL